MRVFITGCSQGLGYELAKEGLQRGHDIIAAVRAENDGIHELKAQYGDKITVPIVDVTDDASIQEAEKLVRSRYGKLDGVINNAAVLLETKYFKGDPIADIDLNNFYRVMDVNVNGVMRVCKRFLPLVYLGDERFVINITSEGAKINTGGYIYPGYSISKYALNMLTQIIRNYTVQTDKNVRVYMIHPGRMQTVMGVENAQIPASEPAQGIWDIAEGKIITERDDFPFINYKGQYMG